MLYFTPSSRIPHLEFSPAVRILLLAVLLLAIPMPLFSHADDVTSTDAIAEVQPGDTVGPPTNESLSTAITLNYCRASFHRIRSTPTDKVLQEEQEKILNNLSLAQLNDPDIVKLYTAVLDEIGNAGLADREKELYQTHHRSSLARKVTWDAVAFSTDLATAQFGSAIRTGANSWWDYRNMSYQHEVDLLKVDRNRVNAVVQKSSQFLDTAWRLAQKRQIPDRWLVRGNDLDALEAACRERDPEVRLRVMRRMEPFMEAYPPYWYYLGRTQQQLGRLPEAISTYERLELIGKGHFRKDDMLATAMANGAGIEDSLGSGRAVEFAQRALEYSTDAWEANLICARILERNGRIAAAEDAILRNIDVNIETAESRVFLASLFYHANEDEKLAKMLQNPAAVAELPAPVLLRCAARLGVKRTPKTVLSAIMSSLEAQPRLVFGPDELYVRAAASWQLHLAQLRAYRGNEPFERPLVVQRGQWIDMRFASTQDWGNPLSSQPQNMSVRLEFQYPDNTVIQVVLDDSRPQGGVRSAISIPSNSSNMLRITDIRVGDERIALSPQSWDNEVISIEVARPVSMIPPPALPSRITDEKTPKEIVAEAEATETIIQ
ncbi:MAG: hypothetical protein KDA90_17715 [Planctomycetaceae bacterium]|nr:hypothetical protein [Planctomycetaceae bacterium]